MREIRFTLNEDSFIYRMFINRKEQYFKCTPKFLGLASSEMLRHIFLKLTVLNSPEIERVIDSINRTNLRKIVRSPFRSENLNMMSMFDRVPRIIDV